MLNFTIYDYLNRPIGMNLDGNIDDIEYIDVQVLTGDEVITIQYKDKNKEPYFVDAATHNPRTQDFFDGHYRLYNKTDIQRWMKFNPRVNKNVKLTLSYVRYEMFEDFAL